MTTPKKRTLTITCAEGEEITKKQHTCFVHNLIADITRPKPLITWTRDLNAGVGSRAYYTNGLAAGTLITLRGLDDQHGVEFTYSRHGKRLYTAVETYDTTNITSDMHLATLLHKVICAVTMAEVAQKKNPPAEAMNALRAKESKPELGCMRVCDIFRKVTAEQLIEYLLKKPSMLSIGVADGSVEQIRYAELIKATVTFMQYAKAEDRAILMEGFSLKGPDGKHCGHLVTAPRLVPGAYVKFNEKYYGGLNPSERNLKFAADIVINLLAGI